MIYIGSVALKHWFPDFKREPKDTDILVQNRDESSIKATTRVEVHNIPPLWDYLDESMTYAPPDVLYTLKMSHAVGFDIHWNKSVFDITFLKEKGCNLIQPLFESLYEFWNKKHGKNKRSDLDMAASEFFDNALKTYNHDYLHTLLNPTPTYTKVLKDGAEVDVSEEKFNLLSFEEKLELVREEVMVMSAERRAGRDFRVAYSWMLKKFIINHAPIWEAIFILNNYRILHKPSFNYVEELNIKLKDLGLPLV